jgi:hypothetical protein
MEADHDCHQDQNYSTCRGSSDSSKDTDEEVGSIQHVADASSSSSFRRVSFSPVSRVAGNEPDDKSVRRSTCLTPRRSSRILSESYSSLHGSMLGLGDMNHGEEEDVEVGSIRYDR